jgi:DNA-binding transcriptional LysR family regulator
MKQDFDWGLIRSFLAALDCGSLLGAAKVLGTSQPTIGRHIAELESQLGVVLFERTGRGLRPSETALRLADSARQMESGALQLSRKVSTAQTRITGTVRLTASQPVACHLLPPILARMRESLPMLTIAPIPMWLAVHREIRTNPRIRAVFDFLGEAIPAALQAPAHAAPA